jgi:hypothetical protein
MAARSKQQPARSEAANISTRQTVPSTPVPRHRWQLLTASVMLALWIVFLAAMAIYG